MFESVSSDAGDIADPRWWVWKGSVARDGLAADVDDRDDEVGDQWWETGYGQRSGREGFAIYDDSGRNRMADFICSAICALSAIESSPIAQSW
jgi:hypothetical protein